MPTRNNLGVNEIKQHDQYYLRDGNVSFVVENDVFRLHRYFFERESGYFRARFNSPSNGEDGSPGCEYKISDVKSSEFADLVWVWYNPRYSFSKQDKGKWLTILRLATKWEFAEIRELAIHHLEKLKFDPVEKIATYRQHSVSDELLFPSYVALCTSSKLPSPEEGKVLSLETVLKIACAREQVVLRAAELGCMTPTMPDAPQDIVLAVVAELFNLTPHSNDHTVRVEDQDWNNKRVSDASSPGAKVITIQEPNPSKKSAKPRSGVLPQNETQRNGKRQ